MGSNTSRDNELLEGRLRAENEERIRRQLEEREREEMEQKAEIKKVSFS